VSLRIAGGLSGQGFGSLGVVTNFAASPVA
jgi:hypothetical protein